MSQEFSLNIGCGSKPLPEGTVGCDLIPNHLPMNGMRVVADAAFLPFAADSFSSVICSHVLEHLSPGNEKKAVFDIARVAANNAQIRLTVPHPTYEKIMASLIPEYHSPKMHQQVISPKNLKDLANQSDLKPINISSDRWLRAFGCIYLAVLNQISPKQVKLETQVGFKADTQNNQLMLSLSLLFTSIEQKSEKIPIITSLMNHVFPFETNLHAVKNWD